jgi:hypothetical protein
VSEYYLAIAVAFFGFVALAAVLLVPIYRFLRREEEHSREWTPERLAERRRAQAPPGDGARTRPPAGPEPPPEPPPEAAPEAAPDAPPEAR